jgi:hypothetical protein
MGKNIQTFVIIGLVGLALYMLKQESKKNMNK